MEEIHEIDSLTRVQKAKICSSLLHRIRVIQGQTSSNFSEPHFIESKEYIRQTTEMINNITEGLRKGCSETLPKNVNDVTAEKEKKNRTKRIKSTDKDDIKQARKKTTVQDIVHFYECGEKVERKSTVKLSQIFNRKEDNQPKEVQGVRDVLMEANNPKIQKRKRRKKRKIEEVDVSISSSMTFNRSDMSVRHHEGDMKVRNRRKPRSTERRIPQCAGDESDIEDDISLMLDLKPTLLENDKPKKKLRVRRSKIKYSNKSRSKDIEEIVSTTINRLNNVNESVQKVIEESLTSEKLSDDPDKTTVNLVLPKDSSSQESSQNWSTVTMSKSNIVEQIEQEKIKYQKEILQEKPAIKPLIMNKSQKISSPSKLKVLQAEISVQTSMGLVDLVGSKRKKKKHKMSEEKIKELERAMEAELLQKKANNADVKVVEIPSSLKKSSNKKKAKKREHVNFISTPELVPVFTNDVPPIILPKRSTKLLQPIKEDAPATDELPLREKTSNNITPKKTSIDSKRRIKSTRTYRNTCKKEMIKTKSADQIIKPTVSVKERIQEKPVTAPSDSIRRRRQRSGSRDENNKNRNGSKERPRSRSRSRDLKNFFQKVCSNTTSTIASVNEQMSGTLKESIAHLNEICSKVRTTLNDMEKDEENYKKLKGKKSYEMSSEGGSFYESTETLIPHDQTTKIILAERPIKQRLHKKPKPQQESKPFSVLTESRDEASMNQLISTISMASDNTDLDVKASIKEVKEEIIELEPKRSSRNRKRRVKVDKVITIPMTPSKTKCQQASSTSNIKKSSANIPIWQRKPPSVIEEIQLTVKKQATTSQYRGFLRALKSFSRRKKSQTRILPNDFKDVMDKQQDKAFDSLSKKKSTTVTRGTKATTSLSSNKTCPNCSTDGKCNCGLTVENTTTSGVLAQQQQKMQWIRTRSDAARKGIQAYDILDEITLKDLEPIQSEYPRRDNLYSSESSKKLEETLLYKLLYHEDPVVLESLLRSTNAPHGDKKNTPKDKPAKLPDGERSVNDAYKLYEQFELNLESTHPSINLSANKGSLCLKPVTKDIILKPEKQKAPLHTCPKEFNDDVVIPHDLKPLVKRPMTPVKKHQGKRKICEIKLKTEEDLNSLRSKKRIEDKIKVIGKTSSIRSITKVKKSKYPKNYGDQKYKVKNILTVMRLSIPKRNPKLYIKKSPVKQSKKIEEGISNNLTISEENKERIFNMSKRDIVRILKPYIFFDLPQLQTLTVMPVCLKHNFQNKSTKSTTLRKSSVSLKDHDDDCQNGKKLCKRCQVLMQGGDERLPNSPQSKKSEPLSQRQLWKNKYKPTPAENLVAKVLGKNGNGKKVESAPPLLSPLEKSKINNDNNNHFVINLSPRQLNKTAENARNKLEEIKNISAEQPFLGENLNDIIDTLEFKIVDVLSNPKNQHSGAFNELETEIKSILTTISNLKEINENKRSIIKERFKSRTEVPQSDLSDVNNLKSLTETSIIDLKNKMSLEMGDLSNLDCVKPMLNGNIKGVDKLGTIDEDFKEKYCDISLEKTFTTLGKDIERVIEGLDTIMALDEEKELQKGNEKEHNELDLSQSYEKGDKNADVDCEKVITTFCEQVDQVIKEISTIGELTTTQDYYEDVPAEASDEYLTPFMKAVKNYRQNQNSSASFVEFLDKLTMLSRDNVSVHIYPSVPVYRATVEHQARVSDVVKTYNQAIQYEELPLEKQNLTKSETENKKLWDNIKTPTNDSGIFEKDVLSNNHWMQTDPVREEEFEDVKSQLVQTSSTEEQFNDIEDYIDSLITSTNTTPTEKVMRLPRYCLIATATKYSQITSDLREMTSVTVGCQMENIEKFAKSQVTSDTFLNASNTDMLEGAEIKHHANKRTSIADSLEKFTNNRAQCYFDGMSDVILNEYPRSIYTDSCLCKEKTEQNSDIHLREKTNSYPVMTASQELSDIISLFDSRKSYSDTNEEDFLDFGFQKSEDSYDSMLARYASSADNVCARPSTSSIANRTCNLKTSKLKKLITVETIDDINPDRHKHLLHSVYGLVFGLMFIGINLNYSC